MTKNSNTEKSACWRPHGYSREQIWQAAKLLPEDWNGSLADCFFCAPFLSVCMCDSPLCLGRFLLLGVSSCHQEEAWWLKAPSSVLCAMLRFRRLFVNAMASSDIIKWSTELCCWLEPFLRNTTMSVERSRHLLSVSYSFYILTEYHRDCLLSLDRPGFHFVLF